MKRYFIKVKRRWCSTCHTRRPHARLWYKGVGEVCVFYNLDTGLCGCSSFDPNKETKYPETPCHGGYMKSWACCKCGATKSSLRKGWVECEIVEVTL